jgi:hypothetical protein
VRRDVTPTKLVADDERQRIPALVNGRSDDRLVLAAVFLGGAQAIMAVDEDVLAGRPVVPENERIADALVQQLPFRGSHLLPA